MSQIKRKFLENNAVDGSKIRLNNNENLKARNAADNADVNVVKVNASDRIEFASVPQSPADASASADLVRYNQFSPVESNVSALVQLSGVASGEIDLGTFSGTIIPDDSTVKGALQSLETYVEALPDPFFYAGTYNASTNSPALSNADTGKNGFVYYVTVAGTQDFGAGNISFEIGDKVVNNGSTWDKWDMTDAVSSVNGQTGAVSLALDDLSDVNAPTPNDNDVLTYDSGAGEWIAAPSAATIYTGGDMITLTGDAFSVDLAAISGLESTAPGQASGELRVKLEASNPSLQINGSNELGAKLDAAGAIESGASGLAVQVDNSTIEISSNDLRVKDLGISTAKLADDSVTAAKLNSDVAGDGLVQGASGELNVNLAAAGALEISADALSVKVDAATIKINGSNNLEGLKHREEEIVLAGGDITNQYVDLAHAVQGASASNNSVSLFVVGGPMQRKAVDYTVSLTGGAGGVTRISFAGDLATGGAAELVAADVLVISYDYLT